MKVTLHGVFPLLMLLLSVAADPAVAQEVRAEQHPVVYAGQQVVVKLFGAGVGTLDSYGSAVLVSEQGHAITVWNHLVNTGYLTAVVADGRRYTVKVMGTSLEHDLAVLKLESEDDETFPFVEWKSFAEATAGEPVLAFSNMFHVATGNEPVSVVHGVIASHSVLDAGLGRWQFPVQTPVYLLDAVTNNSGAAGGLLTNLQGQPLGLLGREIRHRETDAWVNYAVPWKSLQPVLAAVLEGRPITAAAAADAQKQLSDRQLTQQFGLTLLPGFLQKTPAYIDRIIPKSAAAEAGLQRGDLVLMVSDEVIQSVTDFKSALGKLRKGQTVSVTVNRDNRLQNVSLRIP